MTRMRFIKNIEVSNYLNTKHAKLEGFKDINIIIGPNNCGKTSLLRAIHLLSRISIGRYSPAFDCAICTEAFNRSDGMNSVSFPLPERESYLTKPTAKFVYGFDETTIEKVMPEVSRGKDVVLKSLADISQLMYLNRMHAC